MAEREERWIEMDGAWREREREEEAKREKREKVEEQMDSSMAEKQEYISVCIIIS